MSLGATLRGLRWLRWLALGLLALVWCALSFDRGPGSPDGSLTFLENKVVDWRFRHRGPIKAPVRVVYVDVDSASILALGNFPWNRAYFSRAARALIERSGARAVGMDFVFSDAGLPEAVDLDKVQSGNLEFGGYLMGDSQPPIVLGASYASGSVRDADGRSTNKDGKPIIRRLPIIAQGLPPLDDIEPPELPMFSLPEGINWKAQLPGAAIIDTLGGDTRWAAAYAPSSDRTYFHMGVELARICLGLKRSAVRVSRDAIEFTSPNGRVVKRIPLTEQQFIEINWFSRWIDPSNPRCSFFQVAIYADMLTSDKADERKAAEEFFAGLNIKGAVVLIGPVDQLLHDLWPTPMEDTPVPKVGVHGNILKTILSGRFLRRLARWEYVGCILLLSSLTTALVLWGGGRGRSAGLFSMASKGGAVLVVGLYTGFAFWIFSHHDVILPVVAPVGACFTTAFAAVIWQVVEEQKQKGRIKGLFGTYVAPSLVERMVESGEEPKLGGIEETITPYFSDIQSFSTFSEQLNPQQLVELMNEFLTACTDIVQAEGGTLDKYIGDAVVAMYGAPLALPDHAHRACVAALRVQKRVIELREKWKDQGDKWPPIVHELQTRIGLNSGRAVVGNMGSHTRFNYTMMGDNVNLAARMESGAKSWGVYTMCAEATRAASEATSPGDILFRRLAKIVVKGRTQAVPIHEIVALKADVTPQLAECVSLFEQGLDLFYKRDWTGAGALFERSAMLEQNRPKVTPGVKTNPSLLYLEFVKEFIAEPPPADWDGVHVMTEK